MYQAGLPALLYLTPAIYPVSIVPSQFRWLIEMNPLTVLLELVRDPIYYGRIPSPQTFGIALAYALAALASGWIVFRHLAPRFDGRL